MMTIVMRQCLDGLEVGPREEWWHEVIIDAARVA